MHWPDNFELLLETRKPSLVETYMDAFVSFDNILILVVVVFDRLVLC